MRLTRIAPLSCARLLGVLYAGLGLIVGALVSLVVMVGAVAGLAEKSAAAGTLGILFGVGAIVLMPVFYGLLGFVGGALMAALYNLAARVVGGFELELEGLPAPR